MLKAIGIIVVVLVVVLVVFIATRPDSFRIQRSARINAPPETLFALITDLRGWVAWSPWEKIDPELKRTYSGAPSGPGAVYAWEGNRKIGRGRMEITQTSPPSRVLIKLDFLAPLEAHNTAEFTLRPDGDSTLVTWAMYGPNTLLGKLMSLVFSMERMVGTQFESGLANLKAVAER
jgi:uncharacterized protein YndB with AHSA1/START domain